MMSVANLQSVDQQQLIVHWRARLNIDAERFERLYS